MHVYLDERLVTDAAEAVDLARLDHKNVPGAGLELLPVHDIKTAAFPEELDLVVGVTVRAGPASRQGSKEEYGDIHVTVLGPHEPMRAALKGEIILTNAVHPMDAPSRKCHIRGLGTRPQATIMYSL
jgi:hypothetical protein